MKKRSHFAAVILLAGVVLLTATASRAGRVAMSNHSADYCFLYEIHVEYFLGGATFAKKTYYYLLKANSAYNWDDFVGSITSIYVKRMPASNCRKDVAGGDWVELWNYGGKPCGANPFRSFQAWANEKGLLNFECFRKGC